MAIGVSSPASAPVPHISSNDLDPVTGLLSEAAFCARLQSLLADTRESPRPATLALLQLENFYEVRQWVGKSEAGLLLADIARLLALTVPSDALLCRCTNHEFAVLLLDDSSRSASSGRMAICQACAHDKKNRCAAVKPSMTGGSAPSRKSR